MNEINCLECGAVVETEGDLIAGEILECPECGVEMEKTADEKQTHIWYENCGQCGGVFLDAGEFTDLKYDTFMDRIRDLVRGRRPSA